MRLLRIDRKPKPAAASAHDQLIVEMVFGGQINDETYGEFSIRMRERESDEVQLADAKNLLREAIASLRVDSSRN